MNRLLHRYQIPIFLLALILPGLLFAWRIEQISPLFISSTTRNAAKAALTTMTDREGWLLSDVVVENVTTDSVRFIHREHIRGTDPEGCHVLMLNDSSLQPCR